MRIKPNLTIDLSHTRTSSSVSDKLLADNTSYVHGTNIQGLKGIARTNQILTPNDFRQQNITPQSGERGWAQQASSDQPIAQGVSMYSSHEYDQTSTYTAGDIPVIIGIDPGVSMAGRHVQQELGHALSHGSIYSNNISKIYIPNGSIDQVRDALRGEAFSSPILAKVEEYNPIFESP